MPIIDIWWDEIVKKRLKEAKDMDKDIRLILENQIMIKERLDEIEESIKETSQSV